MSVSLEETVGPAAASMQQTKSGPVVETSADAFDKDDFDPLRYINDMFPSGMHAVCEHATKFVNSASQSVQCLIVTGSICSASSPCSTNGMV